MRIPFKVVFLAESLGVNIGEETHQLGIGWGAKE